MAGDWIKMRTTLANDPAVIAIACSLDISEFEVVGMLHHLWCWADAQSRNGHAPGVTKKWVDRYVHRDGFSDAMTSVGWLLVDDSGVSFPNFERHNGKPAKDRALAGERQRLKRANVTQNVPDMSRSERDECVTREEKRREDQKPCAQQAENGHQFKFAEIQSAYNAICSPTLPKCAADNKSRRAQVKLMVDLEFNGKKPFREFGMQMWESYFTDCLTNKHWIGENDSGWKADFDFVTKPKNAIKLLERML